MGDESKSARKLPVWPADYPEGCPEADAKPLNTRVWRRNVSDDDWRTAKENKRYRNDPECQRVSFSCFLDEHALRQTLKLREVDGDAVVFADLKEQHGMIGPPGRNKHVSVWITQAARAEWAKLFQVKR